MRLCIPQLWILDCLNGIVFVPIYKSTNAWFLQFQQDTVLIPPQTAWFGYYAKNHFTVVQAPEEVSAFQS